MRKSVIYAFAMAGWIVINVFFFFFTTIVHERQHQINLGYYGVNSEIKYHFFDFKSRNTAETIPNNNYWEDCTDSCRLANAQIEMVGYSLDLIQLFIFAVGILFICVKAFIYLEEEWLESEKDRFYEYG